MANEDLLLRQMPHSLEGEQAILGSMLIDEGCVKDVMDKLVPSDFYLRQNREIFETIYTMFTYARPIDGIPLLSGAAHGDHPHQRQRDGVCGHRSG